MKYPRIVNWLLWTKKPDGSYQAIDGLTGDRYTFGSVIAQFARGLDGRHNPRSLLPEDPDLAEELLEKLEEGGLLRHSRVLYGDLTSVLYSVWIPRRRMYRSRLLVLLNGLRRLLWLPVLCGGIYIYFTVWSASQGGSVGWGLVLGTVIGAIAHELSHMIACLCYGGCCFEFGVSLRWGLPGAYVLLNTDRIRSRLHRAAVLGAGVQANFLLAGVFFALSVWWESQSLSLYGMAMVNVLLGLVNLLFIDGMDGAKMMGELLGAVDVVDKAKLTLQDRELCRRLWKQGRYEELAACAALAGLQLMFPAFICLNLIEVIVWVTSWF